MPQGKQLAFVPSISFQTPNMRNRLKIDARNTYIVDYNTYGFPYQCISSSSGLKSVLGLNYQQI
jgi:hypothetical protein